jgi:hypothetical protein
MGCKLTNSYPIFDTMQKLNIQLYLFFFVTLSTTPLFGQLVVGSALDYRLNFTDSPANSLFIVPKVGYRFKSIEAFANTSIPYFSETHDRPNWSGGVGANVTFLSTTVINPFRSDSNTVPIKVFASAQYNFGHSYSDRDDYITPIYDGSGSFMYWERQSYQFERRGPFSQAGIGVRATLNRMSPYFFAGLGKSPNLRVIYRIDELQSSGIEANTFEADYTETPLNLQIMFGVDYTLPH